MNIITVRPAGYQCRLPLLATRPLLRLATTAILRYVVITVITIPFLPLAWRSHWLLAVILFSLACRHGASLVALGYANNTTIALRHHHSWFFTPSMPLFSLAWSFATPVISALLAITLYWACYCY